jgi:hypothetical protein
VGLSVVMRGHPTANRGGWEGSFGTAGHPSTRGAVSGSFGRMDDALGLAPAGMSAGAGAPFSERFLDRARLRALATAKRKAYADARPYPHAVFDGFLGDAISADLAARFPGPDHPGWLRRDYREQARLGQLQRTGFEGVDPGVRHLLAELSGMAFLDFLEALTGTGGLIADPHFRGAGPSLTLPGGHLALHADFNRDRGRHLVRRVTVLYYLPRRWAPEWGGALELWDESRTRCEASYLPLRDRLLVMDHGDAYWHGHPTPLACPAGEHRASIAAYYYVATPAAGEDDDAHGAIWGSKRLGEHHLAEKKRHGA